MLSNTPSPAPSVPSVEVMLEQLYRWQWTSNNYNLYRGYQPRDGIAGEHNEKFVVDQMVLRGRPAYIPGEHSKIIYRHFSPHMHAHDGSEAC